MNNNFNENGYIIIKNFINNDDINIIFNELNQIIDYINPDFKNLSIDKKYYLLKDYNNNLRIHFYDILNKLLKLNEIWNSKKIINILKEIKNDIYFVDAIQIRIDTPENDRCLPFHQ